MKIRRPNMDDPCYLKLSCYFNSEISVSDFVEVMNFHF